MHEIRSDQPSFLPDTRQKSRGEWKSNDKLQELLLNRSVSKIGEVLPVNQKYSPWKPVLKCEAKHSGISSLKWFLVVQDKTCDCNHSIPQKIKFKESWQIQLFFILFSPWEELVTLSSTSQLRVSCITLNKLVTWEISHFVTCLRNYWTFSILISQRTNVIVQ